MDIATACRAIRQCNASFVMLKTPTLDAKAAALSVATLKDFLEQARSDGKPIRELDIEQSLLWTPQGMRWVMPFVQSAEEMLARERSKQMN